MANTKVKGYNILLTVGGKSIVGTTADTFSGGGVLKESIQKSDAGQTQYSNAGFEGTHSVNAFVYNGTAATGEINVESLMSNCATNATGTYVLAYGTTAGDPKITGTCTFDSFTLNSDSENYADCTVDITITSAPTVTTV